MIWRAISCKGKIGFYFVEGTIDGPAYVELLKEFLPDEIDKNLRKVSGGSFKMVLSLTGPWLLKNG